jgi:hypothetical protein
MTEGIEIGDIPDKSSIDTAVTGFSNLFRVKLKVTDVLDPNCLSPPPVKAQVGFVYG